MIRIVAESDLYLTTYPNMNIASDEDCDFLISFERFKGATYKIQQVARNNTASSLCAKVMFILGLSENSKCNSSPFRSVLCHTFLISPRLKTSGHEEVSRVAICDVTMG